MAQRLATEYVKANLTLTEAEMNDFERLLAEHGIDFHVSVLDNGNQLLEFHDCGGEGIVIRFARRAGRFVSEGSYRLNAAPLANLMRSAVSRFKGDAIVNRIYANFTMVYYYERGVVVKIVEMNERYTKTIYEFKNLPGRLEQLYRTQQVESEIMLLKEQVNMLLDERNFAANQERTRTIDGRLAELTHRLFVLEA